MHGPALFAHGTSDHCPSADRAALERLRGALESGREFLHDWQAAQRDPQKAAVLIQAERDPVAKARRSRQVGPAIRTWLADGDVLTLQARAAAPGSHSPALPAAAPRALPPPAGASRRR
ncbi:hypothetical protein [Streptomyces uncialis]|uniref:hypothetical protein n=1 Tax=Streptomyces uncialis TaxID=1048205 RepID=UPI002254ADCE|nr:hypothetical protein [Streptomyces uncialis]MCX4659189.1 hypothetical protein [Streptomyces uncialis]